MDAIFIGKFVDILSKFHGFTISFSFITRTAV